MRKLARAPSHLALQKSTRTTEAERKLAATQTNGLWQGTSRLRANPALLRTPATLLQTPTTVIGPGTYLKSIAGVQVQSATVQHFEGLTLPNALMTTTLDVQLAKLTREAFDKVSKQFGGLSKVGYDPTREYSAIDFHAPAVQALIGRDLDPGDPVVLKDSKRFNRSMNEGLPAEDRGDVTIPSSPNCHGTSWEFMRVYQGQSSSHISLMFGDPEIAGAAFSDPARFKQVGTAPPGETPTFLKDLLPGDVVLFKQGEALLHSTTHLGAQLFGEKPDTESDTYGETPYRQVTLDMAIAPIAELAGEAPALVALRPLQRLRPGTEEFSTGGDDKNLEQWAARKGKTIGKPLVREFELRSNGGVMGMFFNAVEVKRVEIGADGRGVIRA